MHHNLEISTCDPLKYKMDIPYLFFQHAWENTSEWKAFSVGILIHLLLRF